jgi:isopentenyl phosphate kinase
MDQSRLVFLKLGGSLITDKTQPLTPRLDVISRLAEEISAAMKASPGLRLLIGHGSGSFGHDVANRYQTHSGGEGTAYWQGFCEVWQAARALNLLVVEALTRSGLPVVVFPPSAMVTAKNRRVHAWDTQPIQLAIEHDLVPVVYGDVVFDLELGGTILSTEDLFQSLVQPLCPQQILIAGQDAGVYGDPQNRRETIARITPGNFEQIQPALAPSRAVDVTGGMLSKVQAMVKLVQENPALKVTIFSGLKAGNLQELLSQPGTQIGTWIARQ